MYSPGYLLKKWREEKHYKQEQIFDGICSKSMYSKYEHGTQIPSRYTFEALCERLGKEYHLYAHTIVDSNHEYFELKYEIRECLINRDYEKGAVLLAEIEKLKLKEKICRQFILFIKTLIEAKGNYKHPNFLSNMNFALSLTAPKFEERLLQFSLYSFDEINILVNIALAYAAIGDAPKAIAIFYHIKEYFDNVPMDAKCKGYFYPIICYNLSKYLGLEHRYNEALEICDLGIKCCIEYDKLYIFAEIIYNKSYVQYELGYEDLALQTLRKSYYISLATGNELMTNHILARLEKNHGLNISNVISV